MTDTTSMTKVLLKREALEVQYKESKEWLDTLAFRQEEVDFLGDLLLNKIINKGMRSEYGKMMLDLEKIHNNLFDYIETDIIAHENTLTISRKTQKNLKDEDLMQHHTLKERMELLTKDFRAFKRVIFRYAKKL